MKTWKIIITAENEHEAEKAILKSFEHFHEHATLGDPLKYIHGGFDDNTSFVIIDKTNPSKKMQEYAREYIQESPVFFRLPAEGNETIDTINFLLEFLKYLETK